jgi:hypothetical protein
VIRTRPQLTLLPLVSGIATLLVVASFAAPVLLLSSEADGEFAMTPASWAMMALGYLVVAYIVIFFNTALVCAADEHFEGGEPTLGTALSAAGRRAGRILPWAIVSATVSFVLRAVQERLAFLGRIVVGLVGLAWALVTFLVLPIIALEGLGTGPAIKRSAQLFKQTWGENVVANAGIGLVGFVAVLAGLPLVAPALTGSAVGIGIGVGLYALWIAVVSVVVSAMTVVFQTALYRYAAGHGVPDAFASTDFGTVFAPRRRRATTI